MGEGEDEEVTLAEEVPPANQQVEVQSPPGDPPRLPPEAAPGEPGAPPQGGGEGGGGEPRFLLTGRALPDLPPPTRVEEEGDGWRAIHRLGALDSFLCTFPLLQEVPEQHKSAWARAHGTILRRWREAVEEEERTTALLWLGFMPQCMQRKPVARGGKVGRAQVAYRYTCLQGGDWGSLVELWEGDVERRQRRSEGRGGRREEEESIETKRREVQGLIQAGQVGRAMNRVTSHGLASADDPEVKRQLKSKFPDRQDILPASVPLVRPIDSFQDLRECLLTLETKRGTSPGSGGMRPEYLVALGERMEARELEDLEAFCLAYTTWGAPSLAIPALALHPNGATVQDSGAGGHPAHRDPALPAAPHPQRGDEAE